MIRFTLIILMFFVSTLRADDRGTSAPYISGDTFRNYCTFTYDELNTMINPDDVKEGDTIFVKIDYVEMFFANVHPYIKARYILVSHNGDDHVVSKFEKYLEDGKVIVWFGQNVESTHPLILHIPIGIANRRWPHGNVRTVKEVQELVPSLHKNILLYMNFSPSTYPQERPFVFNLFQNQPYCFVASWKDHRGYLIEMAQSKFVLSPRGNGIDCHRTWEALLMGSIPIVKTSSLDPLYEKLPVLIIDDWHQINEEFLEDKYKEMNSKKYDLQRLYSPYWLDLIDSYKGVSNSL